MHGQQNVKKMLECLYVVQMHSNLKKKTAYRPVSVAAFFV